MHFPSISSCWRIGFGVFPLFLNFLAYVLLFFLCLSCNYTYRLAHSVLKPFSVFEPCKFCLVFKQEMMMTTFVAHVGMSVTHLLLGDLLSHDHLTFCTHAYNTVKGRLATQPIDAPKLPGLDNLKKMDTFTETLSLSRRPNVVPTGIGKPFFIPFKVVR